jgi:hypothetical protein
MDRAVHRATLYIELCGEGQNFSEVVVPQGEEEVYIITSSHFAIQTGTPLILLYQLTDVME